MSKVIELIKCILITNNDIRFDIPLIQYGNINDKSFIKVIDEYTSNLSFKLLSEYSLMDKIDKFIEISVDEDYFYAEVLSMDSIDEVQGCFKALGISPHILLDKSF